jgi:hypothetical protein
MYLANAVYKEGNKRHMQGDKPFVKQDEFLRIERYGPYMSYVKQHVEYFAKLVLAVIFHCAGER